MKKNIPIDIVQRMAASKAAIVKNACVSHNQYGTEPLVYGSSNVSVRNVTLM